jgi:hypothetical protein
MSGSGVSVAELVAVTVTIFSTGAGVLMAPLHAASKIMKQPVIKWRGTLDLLSIFSTIHKQIKYPLWLRILEPRFCSTVLDCKEALT